MAHKLRNNLHNLESRHQLAPGKPKRASAITGAILLITLLLSSFGLTACAGSSLPTATPGPIVLTDGLGRTVTLPKPAQRVVSMAPSNTEILFAVGAGSQVVGRDEFSDYPAEAKSLPSIGGSFGKYNNEAIIALKPDLVLAAEINTPEQVQALQDLGLSVYLLKNPTSMDELYTNLETVARMTGRQTEAAQLVDSLKARVKTVEDKLSGVTEKPGVFYELDATDPGAPYTAGAGSFIDTLITMAGGKNVASDLQGQYIQISAEELLVRNPQVIVLGDSAYGVTPESVAQRAGWDKIEAVQKSQVYPFDDNLISRPSPRLVDGLEGLAKLIHPEIFK